MGTTHVFFVELCPSAEGCIFGVPAMKQFHRDHLLVAAILGVVIFGICLYRMIQGYD
jgi:hypothetical protein